MNAIYDSVKNKETNSIKEAEQTILEAKINMYKSVTDMLNKQCSRIEQIEMELREIKNENTRMLIMMEKLVD